MSEFTYKNGVRDGRAAATLESERCFAQATRIFIEELEKNKQRVQELLEHNTELLLRARRAEDALKAHLISVQDAENPPDGIASEALDLLSKR